jgi:hypothetical protein
MGAKLTDGQAVLAALHSLELARRDRHLTGYPISAVASVPGEAPDPLREADLDRFGLGDG